MRRTKTKTEITIATRQRTTIRLRHRRLIWCNRCAALVWMLVPEEAAALVQTTVRAIFRCLETGEVHFVETADGALLICRNSLEPGQQIARWESSKRP